MGVMVGLGLNSAVHLTFCNNLKTVQKALVKTLALPVAPDAETPMVRVTARGIERSLVHLPKPFFFKDLLTHVFYVYECFVFMHTRKGNQIPLHMVTSHHVIS